MATDVHYGDTSCQAAGLLLARFEDSTAAQEVVLKLPVSGAYESGSFYRRELPPVLALLERVPAQSVLIDGYAHLGAERRPGLGFRLWEATGLPVIGVAKSAFPGTPPESRLVRGGSAKPLYVTAVGLELEEALAAVARMHGPFRLPTVLKRVDQLARGVARPSCRAEEDGSRDPR